MGRTIDEMIHPKRLLRGIKGVINPGKEEAEAAAARERRLIAQQRQKETTRLAESESEIERRRAISRGRGSRSLLIATSPQGVQTLGGT